MRQSHGHGTGRGHADFVNTVMYRSIAVALPCLVITGCQDDPTRPVPRFVSAAAAANPNNVLSAIVTVQVRDADSVAARFRFSDGTGDESVTPAVPLTGDSARVPVLGLFAERAYVITPIAYNGNRSSEAEPLQFRTEALPLDAPRYATSGSAPSPGYVAFAATPYAIVIDNTGRVVWYRRFPNGTGLNFMAQPNGRYALRPPTPDPADIEPWLELDATGRTTRTLTCADGLQPRLHDLIALPDGSYWILCDEVRTLDLTAFGLPEARVIGTVVQHVAADGTRRFRWSVFDHFTIGADDLSDRLGANVNWTHGNALDLDSDGHLLVSFRNLGEVTKINAVTGAVMWRFGGRNNQFTFDGTAQPAFARQHSVRTYASGALVLLDNSGDPTESRGERYTLNAGTRTARLSASFRSAPSVITPIGRADARSSRSAWRAKSKSTAACSSCRADARSSRSAWRAKSKSTMRRATWCGGSMETPATCFARSAFTHSTHLVRTVCDDARPAPELRARGACAVRPNSAVGRCAHAGLRGHVAADTA